VVGGEKNRISREKGLGEKEGKSAEGTTICRKKKGYKLKREKTRWEARGMTNTLSSDQSLVGKEDPIMIERAGEGVTKKKKKKKPKKTVSRKG